MGLTYQDKQQLLQLGGMLLPVGLQVWEYAQSIPAKTEKAKMDRDQHTLNSLKTMAEITKLQKENETPEPGAVPIAAANGIVRQFNEKADVSNLAGPDGKIPSKLFSTLINAYSQATNVGIRKEENVKKDQKESIQTSRQSLNDVLDQVKQAQDFLKAEPPIIGGREAMENFKNQQLQVAAQLPDLQKRAIMLQEQYDAITGNKQQSANSTPEDMAQVDTVIKQNNFTPERVKLIIARFAQTKDKAQAEADLKSAFGIDSKMLGKIANQFDKTGVKPPK